MDYLSSQSTLLRALFGGTSLTELINTTPDFPRAWDNPLDAGSGQSNIPADHLPRILPSAATPPTVFLPVPDPASLHLLFHWIYFGSTTHIQNFLDQGIIQWEGIARNVEYLGLPIEIKVFLGRWFRDKVPIPNGVPVDDYDSGEHSPTMRTGGERNNSDDDDDEGILPRTGRSPAARSSRSNHRT